ncbi:hypothetical protein [Streptomyces sp.]|uniref:hypothetical protein n=1 Tax=Streptomyces sp. TaxID=1931 RepID=UPI002D7A225F|nr:hypothetical protein [Streptomyces sp.]HET6355406.1 hypothetical protein [Streptomyces sp.]
MDRLNPAFASEFKVLYAERRPLYEMALDRVTDALRAITHDRGRFTVAQQRRVRVEPGRVKEANRLLAKAQNAKYDARIARPEDIFDVITDIAGTRVTCNTTEDVRAIEKAIVSSQTLLHPRAIPLDKAQEDYISAPKPSGYRAVHLLVEVAVPQGGEFRQVSCEVQIRTLLQHAWGELTHEDTFKPEVKVPQLVSALSKRLATALAVLDEIAQDLRDELNKIETAGDGSEVEESAVQQKPGPLPKAWLKQGLLLGVFRDLTGRNLHLSAAQYEHLLRKFTQAQLADATVVREAIDASLSVSRGVFEEFPVHLTDLELLLAATEHKQGEHAVRRALRDQAAQKQERLHQHREFEDMYQPGSLHIGTALRVTKRYAIIQLQAGHTAILSARHLESGKRHVNLEAVVQPGDSVRVEVIHATAEDGRIEVRSNELLSQLVAAYEP